jgi:hypothetical protein
MAPDANIAAILFSVLFSFVLTLWVLQYPVQWLEIYPIVAMASYNRSVISDGGNGCIGFPPTLIWLKVFWRKVCFFSLSLDLTLMIMFKRSETNR